MTAVVLSLRRVWPGPVFGVMVLMAAVLAQWPVRGELFPVALVIALYTVAAMMSRAAALVAAALVVAAEVPTAGQGGWHNGWLARARTRPSGCGAVRMSGSRSRRARRAAPRSPGRGG